MSISSNNNSNVNSGSSLTTPHSKNAAQRTERSTSPYQQRTSQRDNPTQLIIKQAVDFLIQQLEAGKSETLTAYLGAMARFHNYSFGNIMAIARQCPTATRVAGLRAWNELGRYVRKGEKGMPPYRYLSCTTLRAAAALQTRAVLSAEAVTMRVPSGLKAASQTSLT